MNNALDVAVIGLGYFSQFHLSAWAARPDTRLVGVVDPDPDRTAAASTAHGAPGFADVPALLAAAKPDIVDIVAPPPAHAGLVGALAAPGRTLICQKPFCRDLAEAETVTKAAETAGSTLIIHENFRFQPWHRQIRDFLDAGQLGPVYQCRFALRPGDGRGPSAYLSRQPAFQAMPRFLIHETGVHFIDLFRWLFGEINAVYADLRQLNPAIAGEDAGILLLDHAGGTRSAFDGNRLADHATDNPRRTMGEMTIEGEGGTLALDGHGRLRFRPFGAVADRSVALDRAVDETSFGGGCVAALIDHVAAAVQGRGAFENTARDYLAVIRATEAAYRSAAEGRKITLPGIADS